MATLTAGKTQSLLGDDAEYLLGHQCQTISKDMLHLPGPDFVDRVFMPSDRPVAVLRNLRWMFNTGRLGGTGYLSILPVDQGIEHSAGASFAPNPEYFDPARIVELAIEGHFGLFVHRLHAAFGELHLVERRQRALHDPL